MIDWDNLEGTPLNVALSVFTDWRQCAGERCNNRYGVFADGTRCIWGGGWYKRGLGCKGGKDRLPDYAHSIDAQKRDLEPIAREAGFYLLEITETTYGSVEVIWWDGEPDHDNIEGQGITEELARARQLGKVLEKINANKASS